MNSIQKTGLGQKNRNLPFLVLDFGFHVVDGVRRLNLKGDRLPC